MLFSCLCFSCQLQPMLMQTRYIHMCMPMQSHAFTIYAHAHSSPCICQCMSTCPEPMSMSRANFHADCTCSYVNAHAISCIQQPCICTGILMHLPMHILMCMPMQSQCPCRPYVFIYERTCGFMRSTPMHMHRHPDASANASPHVL